MKKVLIITIITTLIIFLALFVLVFLSWDRWRPVISNKEDWVVNLCNHLNNPLTCEKIPTQRVAFLSEEQLRWWFDFQESIGTDSYIQADDEKFGQMTSFIDRHVAKIIAQANPIGSTALEESRIYIFPRSRVSQEEIDKKLNQQGRMDGVIQGGEFTNVHYDILLQEQPVSDTVVGTEIVEPTGKNGACRSRTTYNLLVDVIQKKIIYFDREYEYDAKNCKRYR